MQLKLVYFALGFIAAVLTSLVAEVISDGWSGGVVVVGALMLGAAVGLITGLRLGFGGESR